MQENTLVAKKEAAKIAYQKTIEKIEAAKRRRGNSKDEYSRAQAQTPIGSQSEPIHVHIGW